MAQFRWQGRTSAGHEVKGSLSAGSKDEVLSRLRQQGILVQSIEETGGADEIDYASGRAPQGEPPPGTMAERLARERAQRPQRLKGLLMALAFVAIGFGLGLTSPVITCRCERPAGRGATCTLSESDLGVVPLRTATLAGVRSAAIETLSPGGTSYPGRTFSGTPAPTRVVTLPRVRLVLRGGDGESIGATTWGEEALQKMRTDLVSWLLDDAPGTFARRSVEWSGLLLAGAPLSIGVLMLLLFALSFSRTATGAIYANAERLAAHADARRRHRG